MDAGYRGIPYPEIGCPDRRGSLWSPAVTATPNTYLTSTVEQLLEATPEAYNSVRTHLGKYCFGKTPMQTFLEVKHLSQEKRLDHVAGETPNSTAVG